MKETLKNKLKDIKLKMLGFTLIELLAVIIILGVLSLITYPIIDKSVKSSKEQALKRTIENIEEAAYNYSIENDIGYPIERKELYLSEIQSKGYLNNKIINPVTNEEMQGCVWYYWDESINQYSFEYDSECVKIDTEPIINITYDTSLINNNGWAKEDIAVTITGNGETKYCIGTSECEPNEVIEIGNNTKFITTEGTNNICAVTTNSLGSSEVLCKKIKLDKTQPNVEGIEDKVVQKDEVVELSDGVRYDDTLSGIEGEIIIEPSSIDTSVTGTKQVMYKVIDKAGNIREVIRNIIVDAEAPTIEYNLINESSINSNGWAKENFYVRATITDNSGSGIRSAKSCVSNSSSECSPIAEISGNTKEFYIEVEGSNRLCIEVTDNNNKTNKICSDTYKLDKTAPIAGTANIIGTLGSNGWYTSDVTINVVNGSDNLSGHLSTTSNITSITSNTIGQTVIITTTDLAGNTANREYVVKVDKNSPTLTAKSGNVEITEKDSNLVSNYFNVSYSISGGSISCSPTNTNSLSAGTHTLSCTATGGNGKSVTATKQITVKINEYADNSGANKPELLNNMIPVKYDGSNWVYADIREKWYNYNTKEWANAVVLNSGVSKNVGETINESEIALWYVWIPRYKYQLFNANYESVSAQEIQVVFESGTSTTGTVSCVDAVSGSGNVSEICTNAVNGAWYTHPAFTFGTEQLTGFWVGKFEVSGSTSQITIKPNATTLTRLNVKSYFTAIQNMKNVYGLSGDSHMIKNMEWGAVAYLKQSKFGLGTTDIGVNDYSSEPDGNPYRKLKTGCGTYSNSEFGSTICNEYDTNLGKLASTTGNIYGVYDMAGGAYEFVMGSMVNSFGQFYSNYSGFETKPDNKYCDFYTWDDSLTTNTRAKLGDGIREMTIPRTTTSWYNDSTRFLVYTDSWLYRGGEYGNSESHAGLFASDGRTGTATEIHSSRAILTP